MIISEALDYQTLGVGTHTGGTGPTPITDASGRIDVEPAPTLKDDGTLEGKPTKVMALATSYSNLLANKQAFADAGMSKEYLEMKDKLVAALNKEDGTREKYISRFKNGSIIECDFDAYHLRLMAKVVDYKFSEKSSYTCRMIILRDDTIILSSYPYHEDCNTLIY